MKFHHSVKVEIEAVYALYKEVDGRIGVFPVARALALLSFQLFHSPYFAGVCSVNIIHDDEDWKSENVKDGPLVLREKDVARNEEDDSEGATPEAEPAVESGGQCFFFSRSSLIWRGSCCCSGGTRRNL